MPPALPDDIDHDEWRLHEVVHALRHSREHAHNIRHKGHLRELPAREVLSRIVLGLSAALFPTHYGRPDLSDDSLDYFVGYTLHSTLQQGQVDGATALKINEYRQSMPTNIVLDPQGKVGKLYGAQTTPHIFIIDANGKLAYKGGIDSIASARQEDIAKAEPYVANAIKAIVSGQKVAQPSTRPYGCSVKYAS